MSEPLWDVAIVGAGPAGCGLAASLARAGARIALLERAAFPREKLCGGFVSPEGIALLPRLGIRGTPPVARTALIDRYCMTSPRGRSTGGALPNSPGWGISRSDFDAWLAGEAVAGGATLFDATPVEAVVREAGGWAVHARGNRLRQPLRARFLVLSEGRHGRLAAALRASERTRTGAKSQTRAAGRLAFQTFLEAPHAAADSVELHFFPGGYLGLQPSGGLVNACGILNRPGLLSEGGLDGLLSRARAGNPHCAARLDGAQRVSRWRAAGGLWFGPATPVAGGAFLTGDASGAIEPFTGEGITIALAGAAALAGCLRGALEGPSAEPEAGRQWERVWRRAFLPRLRFCPLLARVARYPALLECAGVVLAGREKLTRRLVVLTRTAPESLADPSGPR